MAAVARKRDKKLLPYARRAASIVATFSAIAIVETTVHAQPPLPDLTDVPVPVVDVFEPAVARQLTEARAETSRLIAAKSGESLAAFGTLCLLYLRYELFDAAEPCLRQARSLEPAEFRWPYYLAFVYTRAADLARAGESVAAALALRPDDVPALLRAGDLHLLAHDTAKAEAAFAKALATDPRSDAARFGLGRVAAARGEHAPAAVQFEAALASQPEGSVVHHHLGMEYRSLGDLDRARAELAKNRQVEIVFDDPLIRALDTLSESRESTFARGIELMQRREIQAAIAAFERVIELDPDDAQAHYNLARAQIESGALDQAEAHLRAAIAAWPEFFDAHLNLAILLGRSGRGEEAAGHIERAVAIDPEHVPTRMLHARVLAERGDQRAAMAELEAIVALDPASIDARLALAQLQVEAGEVDAAKGQLEQVLTAAAASDRDRAQAHLRLARLPRTPPAEAAEHLRAAIVLEPSSVEARGALAERLASAGRLEEAATELSRLVELAPDDPRARVGLATTLVLAGEYARARATLDQSCDRFPDYLALQHLQARLLATCPDPALRDGARAVTIAQKLVERELSVDHIETLAMALAETGRFDDALVWQRRAIDRQTATGANTVSSRTRLALYQAGRPVREPWNESVKAAAASGPPSQR